MDVHFTALVKHLSSRVEVIVLSFGDRQEVRRVDGAEIRTIARKRVYYAVPILAILRLWREVRAVAPDIIHIQGSNPSPYLFAGFLCRKPPKAITVHGLSVEERVAEGSLSKGGARYRLATALDRHFLRKADHVVVVDRKKEEVLVAHGLRTKDDLTVIPNGVDVLPMELRTGDEERWVRMCSHYGLKPSDRKVLCAKGLTANNGQSYLIRAMPSVCGRVSDITLLLAGDGPQIGELRELVGQLGLSQNVIFLGSVPHEDMPELIRRCSIAVLPSVRGMGAEEGSSIFLLEAMAMGKAVIATDIGGNPEIIEDGRTGLLVPEKDIGALSEALWSLLQDEASAHSLGAAARSHILAHRTWDSAVHRYIEVYGKMLDGQ